MLLFVLFILHLGLSSVSEMVRWNRLRFHGHLLHMNDGTYPKKATMHYVDGRKPRCRPHKRLCDVTRVDLKSLHQSNQGAKTRAVWIRALSSKSRYNMQASYPSMWILDCKRLAGW